MAARQPPAAAPLVLRMLLLAAIAALAPLQQRSGINVAVAATLMPAVAPRRMLQADADGHPLRNMHSDARVLRAMWQEAGSPAALSAWAGGDSYEHPVLAIECRPSQSNSMAVVEGHPLSLTWDTLLMYRCSECGNYVTALCLDGRRLDEGSQPGLLERLAPLVAQLSRLQRLTVRHFESAAGTSVLHLNAVTALPALSTIELTDNRKLSGSLPPEWSALTSLTSIHVPRNHLRGPLPVEWSKLTKLAWLYTTSNAIGGPLPAQYSVLQALDTLFLSVNAMTGTLPTEWSALTKLTWLSVRANQLQGTLPEQWSVLRNLDTLSVSFNLLTGALPAAYSTLSNSRTPVGGMWFHHNLFTGTLPAQYSAMKQVQLLSMEFCRLTGTLPAEWSVLTALTNLSLRSQERGKSGCLTGTLPAAWSTLGALSELELNNNTLTGTLPPEWGYSLTRVTQLSLQGNPGLTGAIPASWSALCAKTNVTCR